MGIRITGISTPLGGASWEYTKATEQHAPQPIVPDQKIRVFISSICGAEKYDNVRAALKATIESTKLADVYIFEGKDAATFSAGSHYIFALEDSDVCIFLIDNADGIPTGVQEEIDTVKKRNIKALYYFCDEHSKEKTALEQSLIGAKYAKSQTVHKFDDLSKNGAQALINDIVSIYHYYCQGKIAFRPEDSDSEYQRLDIAGSEKLQLPIIPKSVLKNVDKCRDYILKFVTGHDYSRFTDEAEKTSDIDEWCAQFLAVLFEGVSIKNFNTGMYLETLKCQQTDEHYKIVQIRWQAIQAYFLGDVEKCIEHVDTALKLANNTNQPTWVIKDILIDLRNQSMLRDEMNNRYSEPAAQKELAASSEELYYPILDRIHESLHKKYIEGLYKKKTGSPFSVTIGNNLEQYGDLLASAYVIAMYNGSLTHILMLCSKIKDFLFYLSSRYDDWIFRRDMFKLAIYEGSEKEIKGIKNSYPEILNNLTADDAAAIMTFCNNHTIKHRKLNSWLLGFGAIAYYLSDEDFKKYETILINEIKEWLYEENPILAIGRSIFSFLSGASHRLSQDVIAELCCLFIDKHYIYWYTDMFKFMERNIHLCKMEISSAESLVEHIISVLEDNKGREQLKLSPNFLCVLRKQDRCLTEKLDQKIAQYLPVYYDGDYKLETTVAGERDMSDFIRSHVDHIQHQNEVQGKNGAYFGYGTRNIAIIRSILLETGFEYDTNLMDSIIKNVAATLLISKADIRTKLDAISLLICIVEKYSNDYKRNFDTYVLISQKIDEIDVNEHSIISSNIDSVSLKIGLQFLFSAMGLDAYADILQLMPCTQNDVATTISISSFIAEYLETTNHVVLPEKIDAIVLSYVLQWLHSDNLDIRWNATRILFALSKNPINHNVINHQLLNLIDSDNVYIKNLIMRNLNRADGITTTTKEYIISKCETDANFVVRLVCEEEKTKHLLSRH